MSDLEIQIRTYARWLADTADAAAVHEAAPEPALATTPSPWRRRAVMLAAVAAGVLLVVALGSVVRAPSDGPPADVPAATTASSLPDDPVDTVTLAVGYEVAVVGEPVVVNGVEVWQGAPAPPLTSDARAELIDSTASTPALLEPMPPSDVVLSDDLVDDGLRVVVAAGTLDDVAVLGHASSASAADREVRCVVLAPIADKDGWLSACGAAAANGAVIGVGGGFGTWIVWSGIPERAALVVVRGADGASPHQYPVGRTAAFPARLIAGATQLVAYDADGDTLAVVNTPDSPGPASTTTDGAVTTTTDELDITSVFGDVGAEALAVAGDGRVVAAAGPELLVRDGSAAARSFPWSSTQGASRSSVSSWASRGRWVDPPTAAPTSPSSHPSQGVATSSSCGPWTWCSPTSLAPTPSSTRSSCTSTAPSRR